MNLFKRWRNGPERAQEQLLVRLWALNTMNADTSGQFARTPSKLAIDAQAELKTSLKYMSRTEIEETVTQAACDNLIAFNFRKHLNDGRRDS